MKKSNGITIVALVVTIIVLLILAGIAISLILEPNSKIESKIEEETADRFLIINKQGYYQVVVDKQTKVQYLTCSGASSKSGFILLVDAEGNPLLYEGE